MYGPIDLPRLAAVLGSFPAQIELILRNIFPDHALKDFRAVGTRGLARQNHLPVLKLTDEVEIAAVVVHPGLLPLSNGGHKSRNTHAAQGHGCAAGELLLDHTSTHDTIDAIAAMARFARFISGPGEVPLTNPEIELFLLRLCAGLCRRLGTAPSLLRLNRGKTTNENASALRSFMFHPDSLMDGSEQERSRASDAPRWSSEATGSKQCIGFTRIENEVRQRQCKGVVKNANHRKSS